MLAYLPGKLLLLLLKVKVSPFEDVSVACSVGLLLSGLAYWLIAFFHYTQFYLVWPLAITAITICLHGRQWRTLLPWFKEDALRAKESGKHSRDRSGLALAGVMALGIATLALLPQYYTNLTLRADGTMRVHGVYDVFFHLAIANELTHSIPPQAPVFAGRPLSYHYGMDLAVAMFANVTRLDIPDLTLRFMPTLFLVLSMVSVHCFARAWLDSGYFAALVVFLVFFGEDFSFIPGLLVGEKGDWSVHFFNVPTVLSLFYTNAMLPAVGLLFAGLFCLQRYLRERTAAWLFLSALLFVALMEVKLFTAAHIMCCLGIGALVYRLVFKSTDIFKVAALTGVLTVPLLLSVVLHNRSGVDLVTSFAPWPYISMAMAALGMKNWFMNVFAFSAIALPLYLIGCLGLRVIGVPVILRAIIRPEHDSGLRFILAVFVVVGAVITLTCRIVPSASMNAYNNSVWFLAQSKYVAWIFAVEVIQILYCRFIALRMMPALAAFGVTATALALSVPATVQHFALERDPNRIYRKPVKAELQSYSKEILGLIDYLTKDAQPGDVVLPDDTLLGPVLALTKCRVPLGFFSTFLVSRTEFARREGAERNFWKAWRLGTVQYELLREAGVRYIAVNKQLDGIPSVLPAPLFEAFSNSEYALFKVRQDGLRQQSEFLFRDGHGKTATSESIHNSLGGETLPDISPKFL